MKSDKRSLTETPPEEQSTQKDCPGYGDLLRLTVIPTALSEEIRAKISTHIPLCPRCQRVTKTMNGWVKEDAEVVERIDAIPFLALMDTARDAAEKGDASILAPIVMRCGEYRRDNPGGPYAQTAYEILLFISKHGCAIPQMHARELTKERGAFLH